MYYPVHCIYTVHNSRNAASVLLFVVLRDFKCLQETTSVLCRGLSDMYMGRSIRHPERRQKGKSNVDHCMCILFPILFPIRLNCNWQRLTYLTISVTLVSKMTWMHLLQIILNQIVATS